MELLLKIDDKDVKIRARKSSKAKRIIIKFTPVKGFELVLPAKVTLEQGEQFVKLQRDWIRRQIPKLKPEETATSKFSFLGEELPVLYEVSKDGKLKFKLYKNGLLISAPKSELEKGNGKLDDRLFSAIVNAVYKLQAIRVLTKRVENSAAKLNIKINRVTLRGQTTRWGSCSKQGNISINYKLMQFREEVIDYVIIHELCHRRHFNHSPAFWQEVGKYCPNYKMLEREMRHK